MDVWLKVLTGLAAVAGGAWVWLLVGRGWFWRTDVQLPASSPDSASDQWPAVTAVIPARNGPPVDRKVQAGLVVVSGGQGDDVMPSQKPAKLPRAADGRPLHAGARQLWNAFWASDAAQAVAWEADRHRLVRWIHCVNELLLVEGEFLAQRIVKGSMGQPRLNPLWANIRDLLAEVERAEKVFGMNPRSRFRLGIEYGAARRG